MQIICESIRVTQKFRFFLGLVKKQHFKVKKKTRIFCVSLARGVAGSPHIFFFAPALFTATAPAAIVA